MGILATPPRVTTTSCKGLNKRLLSIIVRYSRGVAGFGMVAMIPMIILPLQEQPDVSYPLTRSNAAIVCRAQDQSTRLIISALYELKQQKELIFPETSWN